MPFLLKCDNSVAAFDELNRNNAISIIPIPKDHMWSFILQRENPSNPFQSLYNQTNDKFNQRITDWKVGNSTYKLDQDRKEQKEYLFSLPATLEQTTYKAFSSIRNESSSWIQNYSQIEFVSPTVEAMKPITGRLKKIALLQKGWDSYNAEPISWETVIRAIDFFTKTLFCLQNLGKKAIPIPFIAPVSSGGIQVEWFTLYKELDFELPEDEKLPIEYLKVDKISGEQEESQVTNIDDLIEIISEWLL
ncbi:MAG: hypothetical protein NT145_01985 [Elusimicrobia bacterium]|nr:hypothetical protein [Elusimicrobiota bacterium]